MGIANMSPRSGRILREDGSVVNEAEGINEDGSRNVQLTGSKAEQSSQQYTEVVTTVSTYNRAEGASQIELYVESGYVRVRTDGQPCTSDTGEPIAAGFGAAWQVASISVYYIQESVITVVSR